MKDKKNAVEARLWVWQLISKSFANSMDFSARNAFA